MALLHMLAGGRLEMRPGFGGGRTVNHHLRGEESATPIRLLWSACAGNLEELVVDHRPVAKRPGNLQERAH